MKIVFLKAYDIPLGAPQNRLLGICRGLINEGCQVQDHQYAPAKLNLPLNLNQYQIYKKVKVYNHAWRCLPIRNRFGQSNGTDGGVFLNDHSFISK